MRGPALRLAAALALAWLAGCGYTVGLKPHGFGGAPVDRLGFEIFDNETRQPNLERELHVALGTAARRWADTRLVAPEAAALVVRGRILEADRQPGIRSRGNQVLESREVVRIEAELYDPRARRTVRRADALVPVGTTLDLADAEVDARSRALRVAAERVLLLLLARPDEEPEPLAPLLAPDLGGSPAVGPAVGPAAGSPAGP